MHELYELKEMLCKELEEYGKKGELTTGSLDVVDKLAHTIKNLQKIIEKYEEEDYSNASYARGGRGGSYRGGSYAYEDGGMMGGGSYEGGSYARGRGRNAKRDSMGRYSSERGYSRDEGMIMELRELMQEAPDERTRMEFQKFIQKIEQM